MAEFNWLEFPTTGSCIICGSPNNDSGFVDLIADTVVRSEPEGDIIGVVDIIICASCVLQAAQRVGGASPSQVDELVARVVEKEEQLEQMRKQVDESNQRWEAVMNLSPEDLMAIKEIKEKSSAVPAGVPTR